MTVNLAAGAAAYADTARKLSTGIGVAAPTQGDGTGFGDLLKNAINGAIDSQKQGEATSMAAVAGKADINSVVMAVTNAQMTLQTVVAVRDKVVQAYQQILQMPI
jgi:flagellar hook-basal body complex protein FliE